MQTTSTSRYLFSLANSKPHRHPQSLFSSTILLLFLRIFFFTLSFSHRHPLNQNQNPHSLPPEHQPEIHIKPKQNPSILFLAQWQLQQQRQATPSAMVCFTSKASLILQLHFHSRLFFLFSFRGQTNKVSFTLRN